MSDAYDSPWKDILEDQFPDFMAPFFAAAAAEIDFASGVEGLDKELAQVVLEAETSKVSDAMPTRHGRAQERLATWVKHLGSQRQA